MRALPILQIAASGHDMPTAPPAPTSKDSKDRPPLERKLLQAYLAHSNLIIVENTQQDPQTAEVSKALLQLTDDYERRYKRDLSELAASWEVSVDDPQSSFKEVLDTMFQDGYNWGRVITVFIFVGLFARKFSGRQDASHSKVTEWAVEYLTEKQLGEWIRKHGGWMGLVQFSNGGNADAVGQPLIPESGLFKRLMTVAGAGIALFTLGHLLTNRA